MGWLKKPKTAEATDESLLDNYRESGDLAVLGRLYERYMPLVYGVCLKYLQDEEQSKDAVMQIFEELIDKTVRHEIKRFRPWLYVLSRNYCLMQLRPARKNDTIAIDDVMESDFLLHHEDTDKEDHLQALERCIEKLNASQQQSIRLFI